MNLTFMIQMKKLMINLYNKKNERGLKWKA